jgi:hypothetical protein
MTDSFETPLSPRVAIAFVIDGVLQQVLNCDPRMGSILLSNPTIVDVTEIFEEELGSSREQKLLITGNTYDEATNTFTFVDTPLEVSVIPFDE